MIATALIAYLIHLTGVIASKTGLFLQKVSHIEKEKRQVQLEDDDTFLRVSSNSMVKNKTPVYYNVKWCFGTFLIFAGCLAQAIVLPWVDLVLISTNSVSAIAYNTFLSIKCLGEKFISKYDVPAFLFMGTGGVTILMLSSTTEKVFTREMIIGILTSNRNLFFGFGVLVFLILTIIYMIIFDE